MLPSVRATWSPRSRSPVLVHRFNWKRLSMAGALAFEPDGSDAHLVFQMRPGAFNDEALIEFLGQLHDLEASRKIIVIWDGLPSHRSRRMIQWIKDEGRCPASRVHIPDLPPREALAVALAALASDFARFGEGAAG
jgi:hypothetical protein